MPSFHRLALVAASLVLTLLFPARPALAEPPSPGLLAKLAAYSASLDALEKHASYRLDMKMDIVDGDDKVDAAMSILAQVDATGPEPKFKYLRWVENGKDKTAEKQAEAKSKKKNAGDVDVDIEMPVDATAQPNYVFDLTEKSQDGTLAKIKFTPKHPGKRTIEGSAWIDPTAGTIVSASFRLTNTPMFVRYLNFTLEFGARTSLGPSISKMTMDGEIAILFFKRRCRATMLVSDYVISP